MTQYGFDNDVDRDAIILTSMISRYFDAEKYTEKGFQDAITLNSDIIYVKKDKTVVIDKLISESEVTFYNNIWLDT